jgi:hypothetical protein
VDADCCSHTWIESIELPALGFPAVVTEVKDLDLCRESESNEEHECLRFYGARIDTDRGSIDIEYRNSSNGYYGGSIVWPGDDHFYGGVFGQNISYENWQEVT